jgi:cell division protein FtsW (lipid II flippase)
MSASPARTLPRRPLPPLLGAIKPRTRWREWWLLVLASGTLVLGSMTLGATVRARPDVLAGRPPATIDLAPYDLGGLALFLGCLFAVHGLFVVTGRRTDQVLLPAVGMLAGLGLLLMQRLPQELASQSLGDSVLGLGELQLVWLVLALGIVATIGTVIRSDSWLRLYKYTWAAVGVGLLLLVFLFGREVNGVRLVLAIGPFAGQPTEILKVILVVFLAGYLSENRALLIEESTRIGPIRLPPIPYLAPMVAMWAIALGIVVVQRDLGAALLFFAVFLALLYVATGRWGYVILGLLLFVAGAFVLYQLFGHVRTRVDIWLDPFAAPLDAGYQIIRALYAFGRGGLIGTGLGAGLPSVGTEPAIPAIHTDFPLAALGEELGLIGLLAILGLYLVVIERGLRIAAAAADDFRALLAAGLAFVVGVQAFIIAAGNLKLIPLTGITLPFVSYGGSSLLANAVIVGLLLALSDRGVEPPPPPKAASRLRRVIARARAA